MSGTAKFTGTGQATAGMTIGQFLVNYDGSLKVDEAANWTFNGEMSFADEFDFDIKDGGFPGTAGVFVFPGGRVGTSKWGWNPVTTCRNAQCSLVNLLASPKSHRFPVSSERAEVSASNIFPDPKWDDYGLETNIGDPLE